MKLILKLSGEHPELPKEEIKVVFESENLTWKIIKMLEKERLLIIDVNTGDARINEIINRFSMVKYAGKFLGIYDKNSFHDSLHEIALEISKELKKNESFAIRSKSQSLAEKLGAAIFQLGFKVDLKNPNKEINVFITEKYFIVGVNLHLRRDFNKRLPKVRPFFHPTAMHPKLAKLLVNLSRAKKGDRLLDPFCGTGSILIEAAIMGMECYGFDISARMISGCKENLKFYGIDAKLFVKDSLNIEEPLFRKFFDAIVTDAPYGRSSRLPYGNIEKFCHRFLEVASGLLKDNRYLVMVMPKKVEISNKKFKIVNRYSLYVHKSLTREIYVLKLN